jgi:hypothetical protein
MPLPRLMPMGQDGKVNGVYTQLVNNFLHSPCLRRMEEDGDMHTNKGGNGEDGNRKVEESEQEYTLYLACDYLENPCLDYQLMKKRAHQVDKGKANLIHKCIVSMLYSTLISLPSEIYPLSHLSNCSSFPPSLRQNQRE